MISSLITLAIVFAIIFVFIVLIRFSHGKKQLAKIARQNERLNEVIIHNKLEISTSEQIDHYLLAIDKTNFMLLYIDYSRPENAAVLLNLWEIKNVEITTEHDHVYEEKKGKAVLVDKQVTKLMLRTTLTDGKDGATLALYDYNNATREFVHCKTRATYWCQLINEMTEELIPVSNAS